MSRSKLKSIFFLSIILFGYVFGQTPTADSMRSALPALRGKERLTALLTLVYNIETKTPQEALSFALEGIALAVKEGDKDGGANAVTFDASGLASGIYLYRIEAGNFVQTRKLVVVK